MTNPATNENPEPDPRLWSVVLAAGAGRRLATVTGGVPKQFWSPDAGRSLLDRTLDRVAPLSTPDRMTIVVDENHAPHVRDLTRRHPHAHLMFQPCDRGTAPGVLFSLLPTLESAAEDVVLITPSDHGVRDDQRFRQAVAQAAAVIRRGEAAMVLFGARATSPSADFGWIVPGALLPIAGGRCREVLEFVEKPPLDRAIDLFERGALWSTMVIVARASTVFTLYKERLPALADQFAAGLGRPARARGDFLRQAYARMPPCDFSSDLLSAAPALAVQVWPSTMGWTDLGTPERLDHWVRTERRRPTHHAA